MHKTHETVLEAINRKAKGTRERPIHLRDPPPSSSLFLIALQAWKHVSLPTPSLETLSSLPFKRSPSPFNRSSSLFKPHSSVIIALHASLFSPRRPSSLSLQSSSPVKLPCRPSSFLIALQASSSLLRLSSSPMNLPSCSPSCSLRFYEKNIQDKLSLIIKTG